MPALSVTASLGATPAPALPPGTEALSEVDSLVVVYPAGEGEDVATNALSAARRAGFLNSLFGISVEAVADDAVTDEQRSRNLLLLGWGNRLLGTDVAPRPFRRDGDGWVFLDGVRIGRDQDLMLAVASPYGHERRMLFWSRIDLDLDKFSVLPFLGSDWAVYRGYEVVRQGMFQSSTAWPPVRNPLAEAELGDFRAGYPVQARSEHYAVHHPPGLVGSEDRQAILAARERALASAAKFLGMPLDGVSIELFLFADAATKERLTGVPDPVHSLARSQELHMLTGHARSPNPHEETHLLAYRRFGPCYHTALHEGLPLALERASGDPSINTYAAALVGQNAIPSIDGLLDEDGVRVLNRGGLGFPASGLLVSWILERGGMDLLQRVYAIKPATAGSLAAAMGVSEEAANGAFAGWVAERAREGDANYRFQLAVADAAKLGGEGDWQAAVERLTAALALRPDDLDALYRLALAEEKAGLPAAAEAHLRQLLERSQSDPGAERYVIFGHYQLGRVLEQQGQVEDARSHYRTMLAMPDRHDSHRMAREALGERQEAPSR